MIASLVTLGQIIDRGRNPEHRKKLLEVAECFAEFCAEPTDPRDIQFDLFFMRRKQFRKFTRSKSKTQWDHKKYSDEIPFFYDRRGGFRL